ncbi:MAG TPA: hypothetical protein VM261_14615 [Kofleriaceae bacterium]|nr:hypothetical protein [Kofleriaceae bacterium]
MDAAEYVVGVVESGGAAAATLHAGGQAIARAHGSHIVVRTSDRAVGIHVDPSVILGEDLRGSWGELARHPLAALFQEVAPGDHVDVRISGAALAPGDHVAVRVRRAGTDLAAVRVVLGADGDAAMRALAHAEAADRAQHDHAQRAAADAAARAERARITPRPPWSRTTPVFGAIALGFLALAASEATGWRGAVPQGGSAAGLWVFGVGLGASTLMMWGTRHDLPFVQRVGATPGPSSRQLVMFFQIAAALLAMMIAFGRNKSGPTTPHPVPGLYVACLFPAVTALIGIVRGFASVRGLVPVEQAARLPLPPPAATWGVVEGIVGRSEGPALSATTARAVQSAGSGRGGWIWEELQTTATATPSFELDAGPWRATVYTSGMTWAAPPAWQPLDEKRAIRAVAAVRSGDRVRVLARTGATPDDRSLRAGGPESLFLVVGTPSAFLRRALRPPVMLALYVALVIASTFV